MASPTRSGTFDELPVGGGGDHESFIVTRPAAQAGLYTYENGVWTKVSGGGGGVASVAAGDGSVTVAGTGANPTVAVAAGGVDGAKVAAAIKDPAAGTAGLRTLGAGAAQAAAGNDSRLSDSRAPSGSAGGDLTGSSYPNPVVAAKKITQPKIANIVPRLGPGGRVAPAYGIASWTADPNAYSVAGMGIGGIHAFYVVNGTPTKPIVLFDANGVARHFVYKSMTSCVDGGEGTNANPSNDTASDASASAVNWNELNFISGRDAPPWQFPYLKRGGSALLSTGGHHMADKRDPMYHQLVASELCGMARTYGIDTFFMDEEADQITDLTQGAAIPDGYDRESDWFFNASLPLHRAVAGALASRGIKYFVNHRGHPNDLFYTGAAGSESGDRADSSMRSIRMLAAAGVKGICTEYFMQNPTTPTQRMDDSIAVTQIAVNGFNSWWQGNTRIQRFCYSLGLEHVAFVYGPATTGNAAALRYAMGSWLLGWDGAASAGMIYFQGNTTDTSPTYRWDTGAPLDANGAWTRPIMAGTRPTYTWYRIFQNGVLRVNTDPTNSQNITVNGVLRSIAASDASFDAT